jgi:hypothetical protein
MEYLTYFWTHENKTYRFHGVRPAYPGSFSRLGYSPEDSKILEKYCDICDSDDRVKPYIMILCNAFDYKEVEYLIQNNKHLFCKEYAGSLCRVVFLIKRFT